MATIADAIEQKINTVRDLMDKDGMFPSDLTCIRCGKVLNADGGHPAELYAGTFNGLCYPCTSSGGYIEHVEILDGALSWSYPPSCPSWRRDREHAIGYADCETCKGSGIEGTHYSNSTRWRDRCKACSERHQAHLVRKHYWWLQSAVLHAAQARFEREQLALVKFKGKSQKARTAALAKAFAEHEDEVGQLYEVAKANVERLKAKVFAYRDRHDIFGQRPPSEEELTIAPHTR
jgi:hypothetical protein